MFFQLVLLSGATIYVTSRIMYPTIRWYYGYVDTDTPEYKRQQIQKFLDETKDKKVIPNSNGENFF